MWFEQPPGERIRAWRDWRLSLDKLPTDELIQRVAADWAQIPLSIHYLHPEIPEDWPNPWQLVYDNMYCELAVALGICYTFSMINRPEFSDVALEVYDTGNEWLNLSLIGQGKYVLNYDIGSVVNIEQVNLNGFKMICRHSKFDL